MVEMRKPSKRKKGIKVLVYGETFTGKTYFVLSFPGIKVIDSEDGYSWYEGEPEGKNLQGIASTQSFYDVEDMLDELENDHEVRTFAVDSETKVYENIQETLLNMDEKRARQKGKDELDANISVRSWGKIKQLAKRIQNAEIRLATQGVNVISVAQSKDVMKDMGNNTRVKVGTTPDMQKNADYAYDLAIRLFVDENGKHMGEILKDRTHVTHKGDMIENPSYEIWRERVEGKDNQGKTIKTDFNDDTKKSAKQYTETLDKVDVLDDGSTTFVEKLQAVVKIIKDDQKKSLQKELIEKTGSKTLADLTGEQEKIAVKVLRKYADKAV